MNTHHIFRYKYASFSSIKPLFDGEHIIFVDFQVTRLITNLLVVYMMVKCRATNAIHRSVCSDKQTIAIYWHATCPSLYDEFLWVEKINDIFACFKVVSLLFKLSIVVLTSAPKFSAINFPTILRATK